MTINCKMNSTNNVISDNLKSNKNTFFQAVEDENENINKFTD